MEFISPTSFIKLLILGSILTLSVGVYSVCDEESIHLLDINEATRRINGTPATGCVWKVSANEGFGLNISFVLSGETTGNNCSLFYVEDAVSFLIYDQNPLNATDSRLINRVDLMYTDVAKSFLTNRSEIWMKVIQSNNSLEDISGQSLSIIYQAYNLSDNQCRLPASLIINGSVSERNLPLGSILNVTCDEGFQSIEHLQSVVVCLTNKDGMAVWNGSFAAGCHLVTPPSNDSISLRNSSDLSPQPTTATNEIETTNVNSEINNSSYLNCNHIFTDSTANVSFNIYGYNTSVCNFTIDITEATSLEVTFYENNLISFVEISGQFLEESFNLSIDDIPKILELRTNKVSIIYHILNDNRNDTLSFFSYSSMKETNMCDPINPPKHGYMSLTDNSPGAEVSFFCPAYHTLIGDSKTRCVISKNRTFHWTHPTPFCECGSTLNVTHWSFSTAELDSLTVTGGTNCSWILINYDVNPYQVSIEFIEVRNGSLTLTIHDFNRTRQYSFDHSSTPSSYNFTTLSHFVVVYIDISVKFLIESANLKITFRSIEPRRTCVSPTINDGTASVNSLTEGSIVDFSCNPGYTIIGETKAFCIWNNASKSLEWSSVAPSCVLYTCSDHNKTRRSKSGNVISPKYLNGTISQNQNCTWIIINPIPGTYTNLTLLYYHFPTSSPSPIFLRIVEVYSNGSEILLKYFRNNTLESETFISNCRLTRLYYHGPVLPAGAYKGFDVMYRTQNINESNTSPKDEISHTTIATNTNTTSIDTNDTITTTTTTTSTTMTNNNSNTRETTNTIPSSSIPTTTTTTTTTTIVPTTTTTTNDNANNTTISNTTDTNTTNTYNHNNNSNTNNNNNNNTNNNNNNSTSQIWSQYSTSSTTLKPIISESSREITVITSTDKATKEIDVYSGNNSQTEFKPTVSTRKTNVGAISVGIIIPLLILLAIGTGVYVWYRKKYPVRMILGKEFQNFTNPLYVKGANSVELNLTPRSSARKATTSLVVKERNPLSVVPPGQDNLGYDDEVDGSKTAVVCESPEDSEENKVASDDNKDDSTDKNILSSTENSEEKSVAADKDLNTKTNIGTISNDDGSDIEIVSKGSSSSSSSEPALISVSEILEQDPAVVSKNDDNLNTDIVLVSLSNDENDSADITADVVSSSNPALNSDNILVSFEDESC